MVETEGQEEQAVTALMVLTVGLGTALARLKLMVAMEETAAPVVTAETAETAVPVVPVKSLATKESGAAAETAETAETVETAETAVTLFKPLIRPVKAAQGVMAVTVVHTALAARAAPREPMGTAVRLGARAPTARTAILFPQRPDSWGYTR